MDWTLPDLSMTPGDQGMTTVDLTGSDGSPGVTTYFGNPTVNMTGAPMYPGDPTADTPSNAFTPASPSAVALLPSASNLNTWINDFGNLLGAGASAYAAANQYQKVPINSGGIPGSAYINTTTGLPAGSASVASALGNFTITPAMLLLGAAALFFALR